MEGADAPEGLKSMLGVEYIGRAQNYSIAEPVVTRPAVYIRALPRTSGATKLPACAQ